MVSQQRRRNLFSPTPQGYQRQIIKEENEGKQPEAPPPLATKVKHTIIGFPGTYGLALSPAIRCDKDSTSDPDLISKVFYREDSVEHAKEEWDIAKKLEGIDPNNKFTLKMVEHCEKQPTQFNIVNKDKLGSKQDIILGNKNSMGIINMTNGGISISDLIKQNMPPIPLLPFLSSIKNILSGLIACYEKGIVHRDIKPANMLIDKNNKITLIDFGVSISPEKVYSSDEHGLLMHKYSAYPPEVPIIGFLHTFTAYDDKTKLMAIINQIIDAVENNIGNSNTTDEFKVEVMRIIVHFMDLLIETDGYNPLSQKELLLSIANKNRLSQKLDNYSLGIVIKELIITKKIADTDPDSPTDFAIVKRDTAFLLKINKIVMGMIKLDPLTRDNPEKSLENIIEFENFVKEYNSQKPAVTGGAPPTARALALMPPPPRRASRVRSAPSATGRIVVPGVKFSEDRKEAYHALAELLDLNPDVADFTINMLSNKHTFDLDQKSPPRSAPAKIGGRRQSKRK